MHPPENADPQDGAEDGYINLGSFAAGDARKILESFTQADLDFVVESDASGLKKAKPNDYFTTFGLGVGLNIWIRDDQYDAASSIVRTFFPV